MNHDISSRICDVALNIVDCLLQLGVVPCVEKKRKKSENKENESSTISGSASVAAEKRQSDGNFQKVSARGSSCGFGVPSAGSGGASSGGGGGSGSGGGGGGDDGSGDQYFEKNEKSMEKVIIRHRNSCVYRNGMSYIVALQNLFIEISCRSAIYIATILVISIAEPYMFL